MLSDRTGKASKNLTENETSSGILPVGEVCWIWLEGASFVKEYILTSIYFRMCMRDRKPFKHTQVKLFQAVVRQVALFSCFEI